MMKILWTRCGQNRWTKLRNVHQWYNHLRKIVHLQSVELLTINTKQSVYRYAAPEWKWLHWLWKSPLMTNKKKTNCNQMHAIFHSLGRNRPRYRFHIYSFLALILSCSDRSNKWFGYRFKSIIVIITYTPSCHVIVRIWIETNGIWCDDCTTML